MTEHRQWESRAFSLRCSVCDLSTNEEAEMSAHASSHTPEGDTRWELRCSPTGPVAMETRVGPPPPTEHCCRICQRSFPGQPELLAHIRGHRQGNQYRCERCGHLARTANKLIEHVRVHTGERPFTCDFCPYSAKRRDSLRLHCKIKHAAHTHTTSGPHTTHLRLGPPRSSCPPPSAPLCPRGGEGGGCLPLYPSPPCSPWGYAPPENPRPPAPPPSLKLSLLSYLGLTRHT
ncbi:zinc finger protein 32-like [Osmerus mordax]|uniref:zinc finger protein 32-like n=1 Tax=Osmerus mordax TaxID=8014 RepID=UPI00350ED95A